MEIEAAVFRRVQEPLTIEAVEIDKPWGREVLVRTAADPMSIAKLMREAVYEVDSDTAVDRVQTLEQVRSDAVASPRLTAILLAMFAGLALVTGPS